MSTSYLTFNLVWDEFTLASIFHCVAGYTPINANFSFNFIQRFEL